MRVPADRLPPPSQQPREGRTGGPSSRAPGQVALPANRHPCWHGPQGGTELLPLPGPFQGPLPTRGNQGSRPGVPAHLWLGQRRAAAVISVEVAPASSSDTGALFPPAGTLGPAAALESVPRRRGPRAGADRWAHARAQTRRHQAPVGAQAREVGGGGGLGQGPCSAHLGAHDQAPPPGRGLVLIACPACALARCLKPRLA